VGQDEVERMKCIKRAIHFDGVNLCFEGHKLSKAPKDLIESTEPIPRERMNEVKQEIVDRVWGVTA
jgi:hypothetical protein